MDVTIEELWACLGSHEPGSLYRGETYEAFRINRQDFLVYKLGTKLMYLVRPIGEPIDLGPKTHDQFEEICRRNCTTIKPINELQQLR